jgi:molybdopterin-containing oxidoreductase family membrane subunit
MLAEVTFCLTCYLMVLSVEYIPLVLKNRRLRRKGEAVVFEFELHHLMVVFAIVGAFLSFFHQGSLGGLFGVMQGRPFAFRQGFLIWPTTFFLFILSAVAVGPSFLLVLTRLARKITQRSLVPSGSLTLLARLSGRILLVYLVLKGIDTLYWLNRTVPGAGFHGYWFYRSEAFGTWILLLELFVFGLVPALILSRQNALSNPLWQTWAAVFACLGIALNRYAMTIQTLALPTLSFESSWAYLPSWQEVAAFAAVVAYGVILFSLSYRYLPLYPKERELAQG